MYEILTQDELLPFWQYATNIQLYGPACNGAGLRITP